MASEEAKVIEMENSTEVLTAFNKIPYALINQEVEFGSHDVLEEFTQICRYYKIYYKGKNFPVEGSNGDYVPANLKYKMAASLINKEARFLFAESPDITINAKGDVGKITDEAKNMLTTYNDLLKSIFDGNEFEQILIKAAKDCFIGKRVAGLVNFNEEDGVTITFLPSTQFLYETQIGNKGKIVKFVCFMIVRDSKRLSDKRIFKKKYVVENDKVFLEEVLYDGAGRIIEEVTTRQEILLDRIPVAIFINDGLTGDDKGESEIEILEDYEKWYSKMSNGDIDAERKTMNPTRYTIDMDSRSTKNLSSSAGSFWDLQSDQNLDKPTPNVGMLESSMGYSDALKTSLDRIKTTAYEQVDMPNITLETMVGSITSGKALKAIYWPLIVRCKEKMKTWGPQLSNIVKIIVEGSLVYPNCIEKYTDEALSPVAYEVDVVGNTPLPEDEIEEKQTDLAEVTAQVMSRKSYMKKWRNLTDDEVQEELEQIALEREMIDDSFQATNNFGSQPYPENSENLKGGTLENPVDEEIETDDDSEFIEE